MTAKQLITLMHFCTFPRIKFKRISSDSRREELRVSLQALRSLNSRRQLNDRSTGEYNGHLRCRLGIPARTTKTPMVAPARLALSPTDEQASFFRRLARYLTISATPISIRQGYTRSITRVFVPRSPRSSSDRIEREREREREERGERR